jgi:hypothetical protein
MTQMTIMTQLPKLFGWRSMVMHDVPFLSIHLIRLRRDARTSPAVGSTAVAIHSVNHREYGCPNRSGKIAQG